MPLARSRACNCAGYAPRLPTYQPWVLLAPIATIRSGADWAVMLPHTDAAMANRKALLRHFAMAVEPRSGDRFSLANFAQGPQQRGKRRLLILRARCWNSASYRHWRRR